MNRVLSAIDATPASAGVMRVAAEVARVMGAEVDVVHVAEGEQTTDAQVLVRDSGLTLRLLDGPVAPTLVSEASAPDVEAVVVGLRKTVGGGPAAGHVAQEVIDHADVIVVIVPPTVTSAFELRRVLVPIQGRPADALERVVRVAQGSDLDVVILHVHDESSIPAFEDQPHYDVEAWADEFLARWVPGARRQPVMEIRVGAPDEEIIKVAHECGAEMIAIGWDRDRSPARAVMGRSALRRSDVPVALLPLGVRDRASIT